MSRPATVLRGAGRIRRVQKLNRNRDYEASQRIAQLSGDIGEYIYNDGRCAVAHAETGTVVNPDVVADERRLAADMPVVRALAEYFIEHDLGVKSQETIWNEHLYELQGFRDHLGASVVTKLKALEDIEAAQLPDLPPLGIRVRGGDLLPSLDGLTVAWRMTINGTLCLQLRHGKYPCLVSLRLNLADEHLEFDPATLVSISETESPEGEQALRDRASLVQGLLRNRQLHVYRSDTGALMGRTDGFLPDDRQWHQMKALLGVA